MISNLISTSFWRTGTIVVMTATTLCGCSTITSVSPFGSNVPYAQTIQPTIARPAVTEIPAFKPKVDVPPAPSAKAAPSVQSPPPAPTAPDAPPPPPASSAIQSTAPKVASAQPAPAPMPTPAPLPAKAEAPAITAPAPASAAAAASAPAAETASSEQVTDDTPSGPSIPPEDRKLSTDGAYPNLAQVPARPVNMPTFAEAAALEKTLVADRKKAKDATPASPEAPPVDSDPIVAVAAAPAAAQPQPVADNPPVVPARAEDSEPCLNLPSVRGELAATLHFDPGSAAITAGNRAVLADAIPAVRAAKGTIRIFGHGDADAAAQSRFDLGAARAAAVAQAVAGYGIPVPRIAVGVACADASLAEASVQLYAES